MVLQDVGSQAVGFKLCCQTLLKLESIPRAKVRTPA